MDTDSRDRESVTGSKGAGWKWIPDQGVYLWWDGERYTGRAEWDGTEWKVGPLAKKSPTPKKPPARGRVAIYLVIAALSLVLTVTFGVWGYAEMESDCRRDYPNMDVDRCVADASMGVDMIGSIGFTVFVVFLVLGIGGVRRRRRARRQLSEPAFPVIDQDRPGALPPPTPVNVDSIRAQPEVERKPKVLATGPIRLWMMGLIATWWAVLIWFVSRTEEKQCFPDEPQKLLTYTDVSNAVVPWLALAALTVVGVTVWRRYAKGVRWVKATVIVGVVLTVMMSPIVVACGGAMNCGL
jgi:hypothetical protein